MKYFMNINLVTDDQSLNEIITSFWASCCGSLRQDVRVPNMLGIFGSLSFLRDRSTSKWEELLNSFSFP
jgi:hypothetical protein